MRSTAPDTPTASLTCSAPAGYDPRARESGDSFDELLSAIENESVVQIPITSLVLTDSPRHTASAEHVRVMAELVANLPPIVVHRSTMRVIDGVHRVHAYRLRGREHIEARFFEGGLEDAFLLAVRSNITHGLPLSLAERGAAAERIVMSHQNWSDRAIAVVVGLNPKTVADIRRRSSEDSAPLNMRIGRDGRARPLDATAGRLRASQVIAARPKASVREIAKEAGISVGTAHDVRERIAKGLDPVPSGNPRRDAEPAVGTRDGNTEPAVRTNRRSAAATSRRLERYHALRKDPSLRYSESGRFLLRWLEMHLVDPDGWRKAVDSVPDHWTGVVGDLARSCIAEWQKIADELQARDR